MKAFRLLALGYALLAMLVAPAWLAADEQSLPTVPQAVDDTAGTADDVLDVAEDAATAAEDEATGDAESRADRRNERDARRKQRDAGPTQRAAAREERPEKPRSDRPSANAAQSSSVTITDFEFSPATITVNVGDTVTWTNEGPTMHTATAEDGSFDTGNLEQGESGSATFNDAGTIPYICTPHPFMKGRVVVRAANTGGGGTGGGTGGGAGGGGSGDGSTDTQVDDGSGVAGVDSGSDDDGSGLPATGFEALLIALLGLATLGAGILLRARMEAS